MDFQRRFGGVARLYGGAGLAAFSAAHVCVIGIGGVGSWTVEALARSAIGRLTLIDLDHVAESNVNRQLPALEPNLGKAKIAVMAERIQQINPDCRIHLVEDFITRDNLAGLIDGEVDFVVDCIDSFRIKAALIAYCKSRKIELVTTGGAGGQRDPTRIRKSDLSRTEQDPLLAKTRRLLRTDYGFSRNPRRRFDVPAVWSDEPLQLSQSGDMACVGTRANLNCGGFGSSVAVTASFGLVAAGLVLDRLVSRESNSG